VLAQEGHYLTLVSLPRDCQRSVALVVLLVRIGTTIKKHPEYRDIPVPHGEVT
jgi:hypothetical protein